MLEPLHAASPSAAIETGTLDWPLRADKFANLSAQPGAPENAPRADKIEKPVGACHSAEGPAECQELAPAAEAEQRGELVAGDETAAAESHRGRPKEFDDFQKAKCCGLIGAGMSQRQASAFLGFHPSIVSKALRRDKKFARDVAQAVASARFQPLYEMIQASKRSWRAAAWLLKHAQPYTDLAERDRRHAARKAEKLAEQQAERDREVRRQQQQERDEEFLATCARMRAGLDSSSPRASWEEPADHD